MSALYCRPLSVSKKHVLDYIKAHPGLLTEEIAARWNHIDHAYRAIAFLWMQGFANRDMVTGAITARDMT